MSKHQPLRRPTPLRPTPLRTTPLRKWRLRLGLSLAQACDLIEARCGRRPSEAKLSRIERHQVIPPNMLPALEAITGIPARELRSDLAGIFERSAACPQ